MIAKTSLIGTKIFFVAVISLGSRAQAFNTALFLKSSGYGAAIGAGVGVTLLAFSEDPGKNISQIGKGAALGLYAGMIVGFVLASPNEEKPNSQSQNFQILPWLPLDGEKKLGVGGLAQFRF
jgi:hypothetical protein